MSFLVAAALAVGLLIAVPIAAHLLRRGRATEQEFPPTALVPVSPPAARQRSRIEDRLLLAIRGAMILALAALGATPLIRCSRLSLAREGGASVALAVVLDDSLSMRAEVDGEPRFDRALDGARQLLASAREGDAVALVLAGEPARLLLSTTTDLGAARRLLEDRVVSDRPTDLGGAVQIARSALGPLPHVDKRVVVLSDFAAADLPEGDPPIVAPLPELRKPVGDCGITLAERRSRRVTIQVACSTAEAGQGRRVEVTADPALSDRDRAPDAGKLPDSGEVLAHAELAARRGLQSVSVELDAPLVGLAVRLSGDDALAADDRLPVLDEPPGLAVGVLAAPESTVMTGGPPVLEQALDALGGDLRVLPMPVLFDDVRELEKYSALVIDDPPGLSPESRAALLQWIGRGGVALALLGPRVESVQLGSTLEPFVSGGAVTWEATESAGIDPGTASWAGAEAASLVDLAPKGRARLSNAAGDAQAAARWSDGEAFLLERDVGRGSVFTAALPSSVAVSDFALRPGFLMLLDHLIGEARRRSGPRRSVAGAAWTFPESAKVQVVGPDGPLELRELSAPSGDGHAKLVVPATLGRHEVTIDGDRSFRVVVPSEAEILEQPRDPTAKGLAQSAAQTTQVDASSELALLLLVLLAGELLLRSYRRYRARPRELAKPA
ncbi:MAG TPA: VWA domain-containing protein [Polyangiaceae bacterium]|nr:VWA domain-containing protein [Polyangiaceae bacterium]